MKDMEKEPNIEHRIEDCLHELLENFGWVFNESPDIQEDWYEVQMEAETGRDREHALANLEGFLVKVKAKIAEIEGKGK